MPKIYIKSINQNTSNISNYYLNLLIKNLIDSLKSNAIECEITENNNYSEIILEFEFVEFNDNNNKNNNISRGISIYVCQAHPDHTRLANCISKNINKILSTKIINFPNNNYKNNIIINFGNSSSEKDIKNFRNNIENIAQEIIMGLDEYFGIPFVPYIQNQIAFSTLDINIYETPNLKSRIIKNITPGEKINITGQWEDWYIINQNNNLGYIQTKNIKLCT